MRSLIREFEVDIKVEGFCKESDMLKEIIAICLEAHTKWLRFGHPEQTGRGKVYEMVDGQPLARISWRSRT